MRKDAQVGTGVWEEGHETPEERYQLGDPAGAPSRGLGHVLVLHQLSNS